MRPRSWLFIALGACVGLAFGIGGFTFTYAKGYSYLTHDPAACANCHVAYKREGAMKISDHHVRSPLLNINRACQTCHKWSEEELKGRVETLQARNQKLRGTAMDALVDLIHELKARKDTGATDAELAEARGFQRKAQFYLDFVEAENSSGFHAPQEAARILGDSINFSRLGQSALRNPQPVQQTAAPKDP
ncbi:ammonia-forming cytochrome c nitrite reductase subunit c552 [Archangium sp.]|uniref:ammonia-forming cytochrome c nitrite reductase subunit c552 n=1 Tax=Archangium sp. TaxID=1872627 RepID=UPI00286B51DA|nr:ammonia-forming cytochrome c nitrite reductase subunit c552 [Archangium sp.]